MAVDWKRLLKKCDQLPETLIVKPIQPSPQVPESNTRRIQFSRENILAQLQNSPCVIPALPDKLKCRKLFDRILSFRFAMRRWDPSFPQYWKHDLPEIAIIGEKSIGKSILWRTLFRQKATVKTSMLPGSTHLLNFFMVGKSHPQFLLVDGPGFDATDEWERCVMDYILTSNRLLVTIVAMKVGSNLERTKSILERLDNMKKPHMLVWIKEKNDSISGHIQYDSKYCLWPVQPSVTLMTDDLELMKLKMNLVSVLEKGMDIDYENIQSVTGSFLRSKMPLPEYDEIDLR